MNANWSVATTGHIAVGDLRHIGVFQPPSASEIQAKNIDQPVHHATIYAEREISVRLVFVALFDIVQHIVDALDVAILVVGTRPQALGPVRIA